MSYIDNLSDRDLTKSMLASLRRAENKKSAVTFQLEADDVLTEQLMAILAAIEALRDAVVAMPAPVVNVPPAPEIPAPVVNLASTDLTDIVTAVTSLNGTGPTAEEIARAIAAVIAPPPATTPGGAEALEAVARALEKLDFRMQGMGTQAYGGGSVSFSASGLTQFRDLFAEFMPDLTGTWSYYAGVSGTVTVTAGQRVVGIAAFSTAGGTVTINGGSAIPIAAGTGWSLNPTGQLVAPTIVFTGTSSYTVEALT